MRKKLLLPIIMLLIVVTVMTFRLRMDASSLNIVDLGPGFEILYGGERYENINPEHIGDWLKVPFKKGDEISLITKLPDSLHDYGNVYESPCVLINTNYCDVRVLVDGVQVDATTPVDPKRLTGDDLFFAHLPADYSSKELTVIYTVRERWIVSSFSVPRLGSYAEMIQQYLRENAIALFVGAFLCITGVLFLFVTLIFMFLTPGVGGQLLSSLICILMGISTLASYHLGSLVLGMTNESQISYATLYLVLPLLVLLVRRVYRLHFPVANTVLLIASSAVAVASILASLFFSIHISDFWMVYQLIGAAVIIYVLASYVVVSRTGHNTFQGSIQMSGPAIHAVFSLLSVVVYYMTFLPGDLRHVLSLYLLMTGMLLFATTRIFLYLVYVRESVGRRKEFSALSSLAYIDKMTGLPNRTRCDEKFFELNRSSLDYCIISLDLNGLKYVNDNFGHDAGDRLLRSFASVVNASFGNAGLCCRMGGDEFLVAIDHISERQVYERLNHMQMLLVRLDEQEPNFKHSCAYGAAWKHELDGGDAHDVYMLADQRMYDRKTEQYKTLRILRRPE